MQPDLLLNGTIFVLINNDDLIILIDHIKNMFNIHFILCPNYQFGISKN